MMSEYNISKAIAGDEAAIIGFQMAMAMETEGLALDKERVQQGVRAVMDDDSRGVYIVAKEGDTPVASLMVTREWSDWNNRWYWWVQSVYVMPQYRNKGVLRAMCLTNLEIAVKISRLALLCGRLCMCKKYGAYDLRFYY